jgi:hypothetical protein
MPSQIRNPQFEIRNPKSLNCPLSAAGCKLLAGYYFGELLEGVSLIPRDFIFWMRVLR